MSLKNMIGKHIQGIYSNSIAIEINKDQSVRLLTDSLEIHWLDTATKEEHFALISYNENADGDDEFSIRFNTSPFTHNLNTAYDRFPYYHILDSRLDVTDPIVDVHLYKYKQSPTEVPTTIVLRTTESIITINAYPVNLQVTISEKENELSSNDSLVELGATIHKQLTEDSKLLKKPKDPMRLKDLKGLRVQGVYSDLMNIQRQDSYVEATSYADVEIHLYDPNTGEETFVLLQPDEDHNGVDTFVVNYAEKPFNKNHHYSPSRSPFEEVYYATHHIQTASLNTFGDVNEMKLYSFHLPHTEGKPYSQDPTNILLKTDYHTVLFSAGPVYIIIEIFKDEAELQPGRLEI
ncbi:hypothetical protein FLK61_39590 [Paenalkalicoccus suaedae]|uniref:Uncharacterized protein n=1 Tax=Paenalkalicoccus suaedae TaxID=2592382 RepID=A0A859FI11_9BACI|nr:hypothetical protein [Paenalkalicoccus suaedae]QKS72719.1 hypothetical protein FLK61_39590 [Paenalkalicoccus suaedae]